MFRTVLMILVMVSLSFSAELVVFDGELARVHAESLEDMNVVYESAGYYVAFVQDGLADGSSVAEIIDSGSIAPEDYVLVHLSSEEGMDHLSELGETVFTDGEKAIVKLEGSMPEPFIRQGVFFVQPLRTMNVLEARNRPFRFQAMPAQDDDVADIVAAVSEDSIQAFIQHLQDYQTRYSSTDNYDTACNWVEDKFTAYGLAAEQQTFPMSGYDCQNVIAELPGTVDTTKIWIICGHLDSTSPSPSTNAPGADDNASGSVAVIEAARVLSTYEFEETIRFICFGGEEQGLWGSEYYAGQASSAGDDIQGVVNLDMLLYAPPGDDIMWVPYNTQSHDLALALEAICDTYVPALNVGIEYSPGTTYSDHSSFWNEGYAAVLGIEQEVFSNPYYHQTSDILANYTQYFPFGTNCIKGSIATVAYLAGPTGGTGTAEEAMGEPGFSLAGISPNPATQLLTIMPASDFSGSLSVALFDITGRRVFSGDYGANAGAVNLDVSRLPNGVYALRVTSGDVSVTESVVIAR